MRPPARGRVLVFGWRNVSVTVSASLVVQPQSVPADASARRSRNIPRYELAARLVGGAPLAPACLRLPLWNGVLVLGYHRISDGRPSAFHPDLFSASVEEFDWQMSILARRFDVIGPDDVPDAVASRGRSVLLTFDDGYRDNYDLAFPALRRRRLEATFFVTTGFLDRPRVPWWDELAWMVQTSRSDVIARGEWLPGDLHLTAGNRREVIRALDGVYKSLPGDRTDAFLDFCGVQAGTGRCDPALGADLWMTWAMAAEMRDAGMTIGGHTVNHPVLARLDPAEQETEIAGCRQRIAQELGIPMEVFAYPVGLPGTFDAHTRACLAREGVRTAFRFGGGKPGRVLDRLAVPRAGVTAESANGFRAKLAVPRVFAKW